jgi:hypothetical protein
MIPVSGSQNHQSNGGDTTPDQDANHHQLFTKISSSRWTMFHADYVCGIV